MTTPHGGVQDVYFTKLEPQFDAITNDTAGMLNGGTSGLESTDAIQALDMKLTPSKEWNEIDEHTCDGSLEGEVAGRVGGRWSINARIRNTVNVNSTPIPVLEDIYRMAMPAALVESAGVSMQFGLSTTVTPLTGILVKYSKSDCRYEVATGAWCESIEWNVPGEGALPEVTAEGGFASFGYLYGAPKVNGAQTAETGIELVAADQYKIGVGAVIACGADDNSGNGHVVVSVGANGDIVTQTPVTCADQDPITPVVPVATLAGTVTGGVLCGLTVDGVAVGMVSGKIRLETGIKMLDREATSDRTTEVIFTGPRRVTGEFEFYFRDEMSAHLGNAWNGAIKPWAMRIGPDVAGTRQTLTAPASRLDVVEVEAPNDDVATYQATIKARKNAAVDDEFTVLTS